MTFVVGQEHVTSVIPSIDSIKAPVLFIGQDGVGKRTFAEELIASVHPTNIRRYIDPSVDDIRFVIDWSRRRSFNAFKVIFIEFTKFNSFAQNALLKLLEEPPDHVKIIMIGQANVFLSTVKSRCLIYNFAPLSRKDLVTILVRCGYDLDTAHVASEYGEGSVHKALSYLDAEEAVSGVMALLNKRPSEGVGSLIKLKSDSQLSIFIEQVMISGWSPASLVVLSKSAGIRAKIFLTLMMGKKSK